MIDVNEIGFTELELETLNKTAEWLRGLEPPAAVEGVRVVIWCRQVPVDLVLCKSQGCDHGHGIGIAFPGTPVIAEI